jgi:hypothetical protein
MSKFGKSPKVVISTMVNKKQVLVEFLTPNDINSRTRRFFKLGDPISFKNNLDRFGVKLVAPKKKICNKCAILECNNFSTKAHYVRTLRQIRCGLPVEPIKLKDMKCRKKYFLMELAYNKQFFLLCKEHHKLWYFFKRSQLNKQYLTKYVRSSIVTSTCF